MELDSILTFMGVITPFALCGVWIATLVTKVSNRALLLEVAKDDHAKRISELEHNTSFHNIEKVVEKVSSRMFESKDFRNSLKVSIKECLVHSENSMAQERVALYKEVSEKMDKLDIILKKLSN